MFNSNIVFVLLIALPTLAYEPAERLKALSFNRPETVLFRSIRSIEVGQGRLGLKRVLADQVPSKDNVLVKCWLADKENESVYIETKGSYKFLNLDDEVEKQNLDEPFGFGDISCQVVRK